MDAGTPASAGSGDLHDFHRLALALEALPLPTVAAINGSAAGGGFELALACDFRLACAGEHRLGLPETSVGIIPGAGGTQRMARLLGTAAALDLVLHAALLTPEEALARGLVHRVFEADRFAEETVAFARDLASRAPLALRAAEARDPGGRGASPGRRPRRRAARVRGDDAQPGCRRRDARLPVRTDLRVEGEVTPCP